MKKITILISLLGLLSLNVFSQYLFTVDVGANYIGYDSKRELIYATIQGSDASYTNSLIAINPYEVIKQLYRLQRNLFMTRSIKHWGLSAYWSSLPRIKFGVTGQENSSQAPNNFTHVLVSCNLNISRPKYRYNTQIQGFARFKFREYTV